jgi:mono/diheme cytochrome c family protein
MRRILRLARLSLVLLAGVLVVAVIVVYAASEARLRRSYQIAVAPLAVSGDPALIERGRHLASAATHCTGCHGGNLGGQVLIDVPPARITPPNLTRGAGGVGARYAEADWVRAIRHGVRPDGTPLLIMPSHNFNALSDADLGAIIAYVRSAAPVDNDPPAFELRPLGRLLLLLGELELPAEQIDHAAQRPPVPPAGRTVAYGRYIATIGNCADCHGAALSGAPTIEPGAPPAPNLTPAGQLQSWTEAGFISAMRTGVTPNGRTLSTAMPWELTGQLNDDELAAIFAYLRSLPPRAYNSNDAIDTAEAATGP